MPKNYDKGTEARYCSCGTRLGRYQKVACSELCRRLAIGQSLKGIKRTSNTPEHNRKISEATRKVWSSDSFRRKMRKSRLEAFSRSETKEKMSRSQKLRWKNPKHRTASVLAARTSVKVMRHLKSAQHREIVSASAIKRIGNGKVFRFKGTYESVKSGSVSYRSSLELGIMKRLDSDKRVTNWKYEPFVIKLKNGLRYVPDFLVETSENTTFLIEGKANWLMRKFREKSLIIYDWCLAKGWRFLIVTESTKDWI